MGFQSLHNTEGHDHNVKARARSQQKTSTVSEKAQDTTKAQYERLSKTGPTDQGTK